MHALSKRSVVAAPQRRLCERTRVLRRVSFVVALGVASACSDDAPAPGTSDSDGAAATNPAVLLSAYVSTPEDRNIYVGVLPEVPSGKVEYDDFREFGSVDVYAANGGVFVWEREPAEMTRFDVTAELELVEGPRLSFLDYGLSGGGNPIFLAEDRAYVLSPALDVIVVFDPKNMEITGTIDVELPERPGLETYALDPYRFGDSVVFLLTSESSESETIHRGVTAMIVSAKNDDPPKFVEDDRCTGGDGAYVDKRGDLYVRANAIWGKYAAYGDEREQVKTCMLRIPAGETEFDPDFVVDFKELTGTYVNGPWFHVEGSKYLAHVWDPEVPIPEDAGEFWNGEGYRPFLVNIDERTAEPYTSLKGGIVNSSLELEVDGVTYYQVNETDVASNGKADVVELRPDGVKKAFEFVSVWAFARIR
jgi:hypothetical protein